MKRICISIEKSLPTNISIVFLLIVSFTNIAFYVAKCCFKKRLKIRDPTDLSRSLRFEIFFPKILLLSKSKARPEVLFVQKRTEPYGPHSRGSPCE